jgi:prolycopene isomerase
MGLGQIVGQCGTHKPEAQTPIEGLLLVGIDAGGGEGMGVHQSVHSAIKVARSVSDGIRGQAGFCYDPRREAFRLA